MKATTTHEVTNTCTCTTYDPVLEEWTDEPSDICYGDCWEMVIEDFHEDTKHLQEKNTTGWWRVSNLRLWDGEVSGYFHATSTVDILQGMTVDGFWTMRYDTYDDRVEYSLAHHDAPTGSATILYPVSEDEAERLGL